MSTLETVIKRIRVKDLGTSLGRFGDRLRGDLGISEMSEKLFRSLPSFRVPSQMDGRRAGAHVLESIQCSRRIVAS